MRVKAFGGPEVLSLEDVAEPRAGAGQVVVVVEAAGVNPVDTYIRMGGPGRALPALPYTPGSDGAGLIEAVGPGVEGWKEGDRVYIAGSLSGTYAEKALCEAGQVHPLPNTVTYAQGAALGIPYATAYRGLFHKGRAVPGESVLVHGASGGVGLAALQWGRAAGLTMIGTAGTEKGLKAAADNGAEHVLDHRTPGYLAKLKHLTGGRGADVILEMLANVNLAQDLEALAPGGRVVIIGSRGKIEIDPRQAMTREAEILGLMQAAATPVERREIHAAIVSGLKRGTLNPVVGRELPLAQAAEAHRAVMQPGALGKIILIP